MRYLSRLIRGRRRRLPTRGPLHCRMRFFFLLCLRALAASSGIAPPDLAENLSGRPLDLPPGHPECLVPHLPPTEEERALWAQLTPANPRF